ncbi:sugar transferase [uncultured Sulfitobacter sp.]|uniref:sugar transferase n=1 Tax=uncultured Sulfitobacter sp. TaxID=191468 RepID=UPI0026240393|nr:sugar transferase [uncultured Sulfitobacter sp.]
MKKFSTNRPGYGLFDLPVASDTLKAAVPYEDLSGTGPEAREYVWEAARAERESPFRLYRDAGKRLMDMTLVLLSLPIALPLIGLCALALYLEGGSPFYTQDRLGRRGRRFSILKLRTMVRNADEVLENYLASDPKLRTEWDHLQKLRVDPRVTRIGRILRATSLDELPQLFNVLRGDMSIVGPRPMMPDQLPMYGDPVSYFALRPGITGLWQVSARNSNGFSHRNEVDATYNTTLSLGTDVKVLVKTVGVVLRRTGC